LHAKKVHPIDLDKLSHLAGKAPKEVSDLWDNVKPWLTDGDCYEHLTALEAHKARAICRLKSSFAEEYTDAGYLRVINSDEARGFCRIFPVAEDAKSRFRVIVHTLTANQELNFDSFQLPTIADVKDFAARHSHTATYDMSSWFSQFGLSEDVQRFFCVLRKKLWHSHTRLPMGFRGACVIAQTAARILAEVAAQFCEVLVYIDNILFGGTPDQIKKGLDAFVAACKDVGAQINEAPDYVVDDSIIRTTNTFCGVVVNTENKTVTVSDKTLTKLECLVATDITKWTKRHAAAVFSTLLFISRVTGGSLAMRFGVFETWRKFRPPAEEDKIDEYWDSSIVFTPHQREAITDWIAWAQARPIGTLRHSWHGRDPDQAIFTDASGQTWAAVQIPKIGDIQSVAGVNHCQSTSSSITEPWAVYNAVKALIPRNLESDTKVAIFTDNTGVVHAINKGFARSWAANRVALLLAKFYPRATFFATHIPGIANIADDISRGKDTSPELTQRFVAHAESFVDDEVKRRILRDLPALSIPYRYGIHPATRR
jgi:hypothetical protein